MLRAEEVGLGLVRYKPACECGPGRGVGFQLEQRIVASAARPRARERKSMKFLASTDPRQRSLICLKNTAAAAAWTFTRKLSWRAFCRPTQTGTSRRAGKCS